jgi:hypothetical protein
MRVKTRNGRFASRETAIYKFCHRTGKTPEEYYTWARQCGLKGSNNRFDRVLAEKLELEDIAELWHFSPMQVPDGLNLQDLSGYIYQHCTNPAEMAACYLELRDCFREYSDKNDFIQANLSGFPRASFLRWSDKNLMPQVSRAWFDDKGLALDVQAEILTGAYFSEISIQDIVDFVLEYKKGKYINEKQVLIARYRDRVAELCGFKVTEQYIEHLAEVVTKTPELKPAEEYVF